MVNVLDLLYYYSKKGRKIDKAFIEKVIKALSEEQDLQEYIRKVSFEQIQDENVPIQYSGYDRKLQVDQKNFEVYYASLQRKVNGQDFGTFERQLVINTWLLHALLHDIEHVNQLKKSRQNYSFENVLLGICYHIDNEILSESKTKQILMLKLGICVNQTLYHNLKLKNRLERIYNRISPIERMADILATKEVIFLLGQIDRVENVEKSIGIFLSTLKRLYLKGYGTISSPTERYLEDIQSWDFIGMEDHFDDRFEKLMEKAKRSSLKNRLFLGLPISELEYQKVKTL